MFTDTLIPASPLRVTGADSFHESGQALLRAGRVDEAYTLFRRGLTRSGSDARLQRDLSLAYFGSNQSAAAARILFDLLRLTPDDAEILLALGDCYLAGNDHASAAVFYRAAGSLAGDSPCIRARLALAAEAPPGPREAWLAEGGLPHGAEVVFGYLQGYARSASPRPTVSRSITVLLSEIIRAPDPVSAVRARLDEVLAGLPGLITLIASRAESEGHLHQASALARLAEQAAL